MAISQQLITQFNADVQPVLFPDNEFYKYSLDDSTAEIREPSKKGKPAVVNVPQEGLPATGGRNPTSFPLQVDDSDDFSLEYEVEYLYTNPRLINTPRQMQANYNKRALEVRNHALVLNTQMAEVCLDAWAPKTGSDFIIDTTGSETAIQSENPKLKGLSVNKKRSSYEDYLKVMSIFIDLDLTNGKDGVFGVGLLPGVFVIDLYTILKEFFNPLKSLEDALLKGGYIGTFLNFRIFVRSHALAYSSGSSKILRTHADGFKLQSSDSQAALFWHPALARRYEGSIEFYEDNKSARNHGDLVSSGGYGGGAKARLDEYGFVALRQANA